MAEILEILAEAAGDLWRLMAKILRPAAQIVVELLPEWTSFRRAERRKLRR